MPLASVQDAAENEPVPLDPKPTVPPGVTVVPVDVSETVAVHVDATPTATGESHETDVDDVRFVAETVAWPELIRCVVSPP